jgi:glutathione peroxidase
MTSIHDFEMTCITGDPVSLGQYKVEVLVIVNVASQCGLTPHYEGLQELHATTDGVQVLGFPCNQFGGQEPGTAEEICDFTSSKYNVTFPLFSKIEVNGPDEAPLYSFLKSAQPGEAETSDIQWNFEKFVIDRDGNVAARFNPMTVPEDLRPLVEQLANGS